MTFVLVHKSCNKLVHLGLNIDQGCTLHIVSLHSCKYRLRTENKKWHVPSKFPRENNWYNLTAPLGCCIGPHHKLYILLTQFHFHTFLARKGGKIVFVETFGTTQLDNQYKYRFQIHLDNAHLHTVNIWFRLKWYFSMFFFQQNIGRRTRIRQDCVYQESRTGNLCCHRGN